ncbi:MAG: signal peptidase I [Clostridiales bacterium]|nr:signal peptidase I [Clostridiales bacterium]MDD6492633.1 signal peptidase I [Bacillota bacterium]
MKREKPVKEKKEKVNKSGMKDWQKSLIILAVVGIVAYLLFSYVILWGIIPSESMAPTLEVGDYAINNGLAYVTHEPQRGDIIIFEAHEKNMEGDTLIKRIIGLPGDDIMFIDGYVHINGQLVYEEYLDEDVETNCMYDFEVPEGCYFVMGDNRENSLDSRFWEDPFVKREEIKGKMITKVPVVRLKKTVTSIFNSIRN